MAIQPPAINIDQDPGITTGTPAVTVASTQAVVNPDGTLNATGTVPFVAGATELNSTVVTVTGNTTTVDSGDNVVVVTTDRNVYVTVNEDNVDQNFITNNVNNVGGSDTEIQYNDAGNFAGDSTFTFDKVTKTVTASAVSTDNLLYANGEPWVFEGSGGTPGGLNGQLQFNDAGIFNGVPGTSYAGGKLNLGPNANVRITGGASGQVLTTDGVGNLSWSSPASSYSNANVASYLPTYAGNIGANYVTVTYDVSANVVDANFLYGDGSNITNIPYAAAANTANIASVANSVAGANIIGTVANANYAAFSGVAGSANAVAGANVTGVVANATYATNSGSASVADSVAVANVVGLGNIATTNFDGSSANVLYGNGAWAPIAMGPTANANYANFAGTAFSVSGSNVSGEVANANYASFANVAEFANNVAVDAVNNNFSYHVVLTTGPGDSTLHNDADDSLQYNPADGILTVTRVDATYFVGDLAFAHGLPAANVTGLGNLATTNLNGNGQTWLSGNGTFANIAIPTVGNIATLNLDGNSSNVLYGNGVFAAAPGGGGGGNIGNLEVTGTTIGIAAGAPESAITIGANNASMTVDTDSGVPKINLQVGSTDSQYYQESFDYTSGTWVTNGLEGQLTITGYSPSFETFLNSLSQYQSFTITVNGSEITATNGYSWGGGNATFFTMLPPSVDPTTVNNIQFNLVFSNKLLMDPDDGTMGIYIGDFNFDIQSQRDVRIAAGDDFNIRANDGFEMRANTNFEVVTNYNNTQQRWSFLNTGNLDIPGNINFSGDPSAAPKLNNFFGVTSAANFEITTNTAFANASWLFDTTGNLVLAGGNGVIQSIPNSSLDPILSNVSTMVLTPDQGYTTQALVLDPTSPGHIHLRAPSATGNIDNPNANLFLGGEESGFEVGIWNGGAPNLFIHSGNNTWTFDNTGTLTIPGNLVASGASPAPSLSGFSSISAVDVITTGNANVYSNGHIAADSATFTGSITAPGSVITTPVPLANLTAVAGARAFASDANLVATGNWGAAVSGGGSNTVPVWSDGASWYIG